MTGRALLAGPDPRSGMERHAAHLARLGPLPAADGLVDALDRSGLRGRGGAAFPVGAKWRSVARNGGGRAVVLANGAEGEVLSHKDRVLMQSRPHLVLDGALLAAQAAGARDVVLYVGVDHTAALAAMEGAVAERPDRERRLLRIVAAPVRYVSGEESAAVHYVNDGVALPTSVPPRPYERGVNGRATLVQNVESLAWAALIARHGDAWYRSLGRHGSAGTSLLSVVGAVRAPGVVEVAQGVSVLEALDAAGGTTAPLSAVLLGGYAGGWVTAGELADLPVDAAVLRERGHALGCGIAAALPQGRCGVSETARILAYLAEQSARQCGPCVFGLRAIADAAGRLAAGVPVRGDLDRLRRWAGEIPGRGACGHPDGAVRLLLSALRAFAAEFALHERRRCSTAATSRAA